MGVMICCGVAVRRVGMVGECRNGWRECEKDAGTDCEDGDSGTDS